MMYETSKGLYDHIAADARGACAPRDRPARAGRTSGAFASDNPADGSLERAGPRRDRHAGQGDRRARKCRSRIARRIFVERRNRARGAVARTSRRRSKTARPRASFCQISEPARNSVKTEAFTPKLLTVFREGYSATAFRADAIAGLTVAIVALPLAMALGIASGASPDKGLITALVPRSEERRGGKGVVST